MVCPSQELEIIGSGEIIEEQRLVDFRLLFEGRLPSSGSATDKHNIRRILSPQLKRLWSINPNLRSLAVQNGNNGTIGSSEEEYFQRGIAAIGKNWNRANYNLVPIVTPDMTLRCKLDITLLRAEGERYILRKGDIDGKLKTLFDALRIPDSAAETGGAEPTEEENPLFVLLQDDRLITDVSVTTDQLLMLPNERQVRADDAHVIIHVQLNHVPARTFDNYFG